MPSSSGLSARSESSPMCWGERVDERLPDNGPVPTRAGRYGDVRRHQTRQGSRRRLRGLSCQLPGPVQQVIRGNDLAHQRDTQRVFRREAACLTQRDHPQGVGKPDAATRPARALPPVRSSRACRRIWRSSTRSRRRQQTKWSPPATHMPLTAKIVGTQTSFCSGVIFMLSLTSRSFSRLRWAPRSTFWCRSMPGRGIPATGCPPK